VTSSRGLRTVGVIVALGLGLLVAHLFPTASRFDPGFAERLWLSRQSDLIIHVGLMLVGALGIRALLPEDDEEEEPPHGPMA
jgi:hypothetical protein